MQANRKRLLLCCAAHFAVDFACALLLLGVLSREESRPAWFLLYNFCAFALQMPLGILADGRSRPLRMAAAGCLCTACAYLFSAVPILAVLVGGTGNALFHVGAGLTVMKMENRRCGPLGLFVSPGALGLSLGAALSAAGPGPALAAPLLLLFLAGLLWQVQAGIRPEGLPFSPVLSAGSLPAAVCLFLVVFLRSLLSLSLPLPWKGEGVWGFGLAFAPLLGKALGGIFADRFQARLVSLLSLAVSVPLLLLCHIPPVGLMAVLLFNMTMPVTLWAMARLLPGARGFSFGLLSFALFLGFLPSYLCAGWSLSPAGAAAAAGVSLFLLWMGLRNAE